MIFSTISERFPFFPDLPEIRLRLLQLCRIAQNRGGVVDGGQPGVFAIKKGSVLPGDPVVGADDPLGGDPSQTDDDFGPDQQRLVFQVGDAGLLLLGKRIAVVRRVAFDNICQVDVLPVQADAPQQVVEHGSGGAGERDSVPVLAVPGRLGDKKNGGVQIALPHNRPVPRARQLAPRTVIYKIF